MRFGPIGVAAPLLTLRFGSKTINWSAWPQLAAYPELGLIYNRVKKNANTTTVYLLREIEGGIVDTTIDAKKKSRKIDANFATALSTRSSLFFVIVRCPYSRVLSAFLDKFRQEKYKEEYGDFSLTPEGFALFVDWLSAGGLNRNGHWDLQSKQMFLPMKDFDVVVRFENLKQEMTTLLSRKNLQLPQGRLDAPYPADANKRTSADSRLGQFYTPRIRSVVAELYASDFEALKYNR